MSRYAIIGQGVILAEEWPPVGAQRDRYECIAALRRLCGAGVRRVVHAVVPQQRAAGRGGAAHRTRHGEQPDGERGPLYAPNQYTVRLHPDDYKAFEPYRARLEREMAAFVRETAQERGWELMARPA